MPVPVHQLAANRPHVDRRYGARQRQQNRQHADHADQLGGMRADEGRKREWHAEAVRVRRDVFQHHGKLALLVDDAGVVWDIELGVVGGRELACAVEQDGVAVLVEARLGVVNDGVGEQRYERRLHVRADDQGDAGRQQRDVVGRDQRIELHRALAQDDLAEGRKTVGIGFRLRREVHQANIGHAQELLDFVGVRGDDEDGGVGGARHERGGIGLEVLVDEGGVLLLDDAVGAHEQPGDASRAAVARADENALALEIA